MDRREAIEYDASLKKELKQAALNCNLDESVGAKLINDYITVFPDDARKGMIFLGKDAASYKPGKDNMFIKIDLSVLKGSWEWQKKVYQSLEHYIDVAIDKMDNLENKNHGQIKDSVRDYNSEPTVSGYGTVPMVSEEKYEYGAEAFEAFMARQGNMEIYTDTI